MAKEDLGKETEGAGMKRRSIDETRKKRRGWRQRLVAAAGRKRAEHGGHLHCTRDNTRMMWRDELIKLIIRGNPTPTASSPNGRQNRRAGTWTGISRTAGRPMYQRTSTHKTTDTQAHYGTTDVLSSTLLMKIQVLFVLYTHPSISI